jgi:hypothetical protein
MGLHLGHAEEVDEARKVCVLDLTKVIASFCWRARSELFFLKI